MTTFSNFTNSDILERLDACSQRSQIQTYLCDVMDDAWAEIRTLREQVRVAREALTEIAHQGVQGRGTALAALAQMETPHD